MVKDLEARQNEREHYQREDHILRMDLERERHAEQIEAVRKELQEWEAKREELAAQQHRDPENEEGIEQIIALLKDQMANQESALLNLRECELLSQGIQRINNTLTKSCYSSSDSKDQRHWFGIRRSHSGYQRRDVKISG